VLFFIVLPFLCKPILAFYAHATWRHVRPYALKNNSSSINFIHMKSFNFSRELALAAFVLSVFVSCKDDADAPALPAYDVTIKETTAGKVLVDGSGRTLYFFTKDVAGNSVCTGNCAETWPAFSKDNIKLDPALTASEFGSITRTDNGTQVTYKGWPLYYYKNDAVAGDVKGDNVGSIWFAAKTTYSLMLGNLQLVGHDGKSYKSDYTEGTGETQFFTDDMGHTIYGFINDKKNKNNYTKQDFSNDGTWPIFMTELKDVPSSVDKSLFGVIDVFGKKQLTYKGWPLYYFGSDNKVRGATKGVSFPKTGVWPIVNNNSPVAPE
jgi:predicted lipoprotein with Yx(FWY)xxD motif